MKETFIGLIRREFVRELEQSCFKSSADQILAETGIELSDPAIYFLTQFTDQLRVVVYKMLDVLDQSTLSAVKNIIAPGAFQLLASHYLFGDSKTAKLCEGVSAVLTAAFVLKTVNDMERAKSKATKILGFLGNAEQNAPNEEMINRLAIRYWSEFRLHIELLKRGSEGSDVLIHYLSSQIVETIMDIPHNMLRSTENVLNHIYTEILRGKKGFLNSQSIPSTQLKTNMGSDFGNLEELITQSPRIVFESQSMPGAALFLQIVKIYGSTRIKKRAGEPVDADDAHKYPAVVIMTASELDRLPDFTKHAEYTIQMPDLKRNNNALQIDADGYCELYKHAANVKRKQKSEHVLFDLLALMSQFYKISLTLLGAISNLRLYSWVNAVHQLYNLVNIYDKYIYGTVNSNHLIDQSYKDFQPLFQSCTEYAEQMRHLFLADEATIQKRAEGLKRVNDVRSKTRLAFTMPQVDALKKYPGLFQEPAKVTTNLEEFDYHLDDQIETRFGSCVFSLALETALKKNVAYRGKNFTLTKGCALDAEKINNYNYLLNKYFASFQRKEFVVAIYALVGAAYYLTFAINDNFLFIQSNDALINNIKSVCDGLLAEFKCVLDELGNMGDIKQSIIAYVGHDDEIVGMASSILSALDETKRVYDGCKTVKDDKTVLEKFKALPLETKMQYAAGGVGIIAIFVGGVTYVASLVLSSTPKKDNKTDPNTPKTENTNQSTAPTSGRIGVSGSLLIGGAAGISLVGVAVIAAEIFNDYVAKKRMLGEAKCSPLLIRMIKNPAQVFSSGFLKKFESKDSLQALVEPESQQRIAYNN